MHTNNPLAVSGIHGLEHAKAAYANAQEIIRFVDNKTSILTGLIVVTTAFPISVLHWCLQNDNGVIKKVLALHPCLIWWAWGGLALAIAAGGVALLFTMASLVPRNPANGFTVLFPLHKDSQKVEFENLLLTLKGGYSQDDRIAEYAKQIQDVGLILYRKTHRQRCAVRAFQTEMGILFVVAAIGGWIGVH